MSSGTIYADVTVSGVLVQNIEYRVVPNDAQALDIFIGRSYTEDLRVN